MEKLTAEGRRVVEDVAKRYGVGEDAVVTLISALAAGRGTQAQFSHPDLGGMGQWSRGGMIMIGDMFNDALKDRVGRMCTELSGLLGEGGLLAEEPPEQNRSPARWPAALGRPSSSGSQNDLHYAVFPEARRLAIEQGGRTTIYDTGDHRITGFSQQQGGDQTISFTSQHGAVSVADLPVVGPEDEAPATTGSADRAAPADGRTAPPPPVAAADARPGAQDDILGKIERLAELRKKDVITADEFDAKKAELLGRL